MGYIERAAESYAKVVDLAPLHLDARISLSTLQQQLGRPEKALEALEPMYDPDTLAQDANAAQQVIGIWWAEPTKSDSLTSCLAPNIAVAFLLLHHTAQLSVHSYSKTLFTHTATQKRLCYTNNFVNIFFSPFNCQELKLLLHRSTLLHSQGNMYGYVDSLLTMLAMLLKVGQSLALPPCHVADLVGTPFSS